MSYAIAVKYSTDTNNKLNWKDGFPSFLLLFDF